MTERAYDGSAARTLPGPETVVQTQASPKNSRPQTGAEGQKEKGADRTDHRHPWSVAPTMVAAILAVAAVVVLVLVSYAQLVVVNDQLVGLRSDLKALQSEETKLMSQYEMAYDLQEIEKQMLSSGKMNKIQGWQTYTLELSEPDSVEYYHASDMEERLATLASDLIAGVKEYFGLRIT